MDRGGGFPLWFWQRRHGDRPDRADHADTPHASYDHPRLLSRAAAHGIMVGAPTVVSFRTFPHDPRSRPLRDHGRRCGIRYSARHLLFHPLRRNAQRKKSLARGHRIRHRPAHEVLDAAPCTALYICPARAVDPGHVQRPAPRDHRRWLAIFQKCVSHFPHRLRLCCLSNLFPFHRTLSHRKTSLRHDHDPELLLDRTHAGGPDMPRARAALPI